MLHTLDLNGTWGIRWTDFMRGRLEYATRDSTDERKYLPATVPGDVHLDLWKAGLLADPYVGINVLAARWVEEMYWSYRREFDVPEEAMKEGVRAWLNFEGLDLVATVVLNGQEIGKHNNYFYPCRLEVTGKLRPGKNVLAVHLDSGLWWAREKPTDGWCWPDSYLTKRHWLRKPQCQFAWDWSQRLINVGIHKPVSLQWTSDPVRVEQFVPLAEVSEDLASGTVRARLFVENLGSEVQKGTLRVELAATGGTPVVQTAEVEIKSGLNPVEAMLTLDHPALWWPVGHGEQNRHTVRAILSVGGREIGAREAKVGFRRVVVNQEKHPEKGRYFIIEVNNRPIFCKGANFVPADMIFSRIDRARYEKLIDLALEANFNFLRVWGGGLYESDDFYELCDAKGILVWQDFIFACGRYPTINEEFLNDVKREATYQIRRLASRPSLIVWCGNNEQEQASWLWGFDKGVAMPDYSLYHLTLPRLLKQEDGTRYYQPSSPYSPDLASPIAYECGDQHPWQVGFENTDFRDLRNFICRFPDEGGILGPAGPTTLRKCLQGGEEKAGSFAWQVHENSLDSWGEPSYIDNLMPQWLGKDIRDMTLEQYAYYGGLIQGEGLREYCDNFHRRMFDSAAAVFWMFNDCWPAVRSWTIVDYDLRRTPAFHAVRRALQPVNVVVAPEGEQVVVFGINETQETIRAELRYGVFHLDGVYPMDEKRTVELLPNASTRLASFPASRLSDPKSAAAFAVLHRESQLLARNRLFFPFFKELNWAKPEIRVHLDNGAAVFQSRQFAWGVCLDLDGERPMADNFFDLYPDQPYRVDWEGNVLPKVLFVGNLV